MKTKKQLYYSLSPLAFSIIFYVLSFSLYSTFVLWENKPEALAWTLGLLSCLAFFFFAPPIAIACNTTSIIVQAKAIKRKENPLWLNILLIVLSSIIIIASITVFISFWIKA